MEVMNENHIPREDKPKKSQADVNKGGYLFLGVILVLIGFLWLMNNFGVFGSRFFDIVFSWQMLMVVIGAYLLAVRKYAAGIIVGGLGVLFLMMELFDIYISLGKVILPSIVIAVGASVLVTKLGNK